MSRLDDIRRFYDLLDALRDRLGGTRTLGECHGRMEWPAQGVYFFFEPGEMRSHSGEGPRVVRVGTHAVSVRSRATLWARLSNHRSGNSRASVFRKLLGEAIAASRPGFTCPGWGKHGVKYRHLRPAEAPLEQAVSDHLWRMPFLWLPAEDEASPMSIRARIERDSIALLSNYGRAGTDVIDPPSQAWLGRFSPRERVYGSGLWNIDGVDRLVWGDRFLDELQDLVDRV
jgi:hypothetical protein